MHSVFYRVSLMMLACPLLTLGQNSTGNYTSLPLKDLSLFETGANNWTIKGDVSASPLAASKPVSKSGDGVLVGTPGKPLTTKFRANDLKFYAEFLVAPGSEGSIVLPGGQKVKISDSHARLVPDAHTTGYVGQFPTQNAAKAPGLWQVIEIAFDANLPGKPNAARLNTIKLNGVNVLETVYLPTAKAANEGQPLLFEVDKGTIAFRNIGYQLLESRKPVSLKNLTYQVFADKWDAKTYSKLDHEGKSEFLTQEVTNGMREFHLVYEGDVVVDEAGDYYITTIYSGPMLSLDIDGKSVLNLGEASSQETNTGKVALSQGTHRIKLHYSRFPWRPSALGMRIEKAGVRPYDLHALSSLPEPEPKPNISVKPELGPEMVRSFVLLEGEKYKRTHCISVGSPTGWNYTIDLNRGALLQAWRGNFADVTEMWYERGEPQLLFPAGLTVPVSGKSSVAALADTQAAWPDSADVNYLGYRINAQGSPVYRYGIASATVTDELSSTANGLVRTFRTEGAPAKPLHALIASGDNIVQIEKGLYRVDNRYYVQFDKKSTPVVRPAGSAKELIMPIAGTLSYTLFW